MTVVAEIKDVHVCDLSDETLLYSEDGAIPSLGFDSLDAFELAMALEERFGLDLTLDVDLQGFRTIGAVTEYVIGHTPPFR
jgi:acyl carrier protein